MAYTAKGSFVANVGEYDTKAEIGSASGYVAGSLAFAKDTGPVYTDGTSWHSTAVRKSISAGNTGTAPVPDCSLGLVQSWTQDGSVTWGVPTNTTNLYPGEELVLLVTKDATGTARTTAFNAIYRNAPTIASTSTSGAKATYVFKWDGTSWQYVGGSTAFA